MICSDLSEDEMRLKMTTSSHLLHAQRVCSVCSAESIEANVESADTHVQSGTQQLARAAEYQVKLNNTGNTKKRRGG